jgi:hypothetical protein
VLPVPRDFAPVVRQRDALDLRAADVDPDAHGATIASCPPDF